jgi:hypothetical protein
MHNSGCRSNDHCRGIPASNPIMVVRLMFGPLANCGLINHQLLNCEKILILSPAPQNSAAFPVQCMLHPSASTGAPGL